MRVGNSFGVVAGLSAALLASAATPLAGAFQLAHASRPAGSRPAGWRLVKYFGDCSSAGAQSVAVTGASDAWASGEAFRFQCDTPGLLLAHWNGRSWRDLPPPPGFSFSDRDYVSVGYGAAALPGSYAWTFVVRTNFVTMINESFALLRAGGRWRAFRLPDGSKLTSALAFSRTDAWAFGYINPASPAAYAIRFDGRRWRPYYVPVVPQATASAGPRSIWAVGPSGKYPDAAVYALAHWTGHWRARPFPAGVVPADDSLIASWVAPDSASGAWVDADLAVFTGAPAPTDRGGVLLHWTGGAWKVVKIPTGIVSLGPLARDGHGGLWIAGYSKQCSGCDNLTMLHYRAGAWSRTRLRIPGAVVTGMRNIFGTRSLWASATGVLAPGNQGDAVGAMLKFGP